MIQNETVSSPLELTKDSTLIDVLRWRAKHQADQTAYIFLADGEQQESRLSYAELDRRARAIGRTLQRLQAGGERVLLLYPPGLDYIAAFLGCLYAGAVAVPAYPPHSNRSLTRIQSIVDDSRATIVFTRAQMLAKTSRWFERVPGLADLQWVATDEIPEEEGEDWQDPALSTTALAFLQYTSGSTAAPKGVMVSHRNIIYNLSIIQIYHQSSARSVGVSWLPMFHDMGLIAGVLYPLYIGFPEVLMAPTAFLQRPLRWLEVLSRYGGTFSCAPNFAYELCINRITPEECARLDLSNWQSAISGAEPVRVETMERFTEVFQACGFRREAFSPSYGLAEGTLVVTSVTEAASSVKFFDAFALKQHTVIELPAPGEETQTLVGNGRVAGQRVIIAHPETMTLCAEHEVGEIWLAGESVAQGYWNNPAETERTFAAFLADTGEGPFLRTGDLGFLAAEDLFVTGRLKDLIILRGQNYYPQDIELTVAQSHRALRPDSGAAFSIEVVEETVSGLFMGSEERLVVVQELQRHYDDTADIFAAIRQAVAEMYEIEVYAIVLVKYGSILKTSSGKIQRRACREQFLAGELEEIASDIRSPSTMQLPSMRPERRFSSALLRAVSREEGYELLEGYFLENLAPLLGVAPDKLRGLHSLGSLGLDSLKMSQLKNSIDVDFEIDLPVSSFFQDNDLSALIFETLDLIKDEQAFQKGPRLVRVEQETADSTLSFNQEQLWFFEQLERGSSVYTIPTALLLQGPLDLTALECALQEMIQRHEALRTTFVQINGMPAQHIEPFVPFSLSVVDLTHISTDERERAAQQFAIQEAQIPFDLSTGPLFRVKLFRLEEEKHVLVLTIHHLISDEWSFKVFFHELSLLYAGDGAQLPEIPVRYTDYTHWQRQLQYTEEMAEQLAYWKEQLQGLQHLDLPVDHVRPAIQSYQGKQYAFTLPEALTDEIRSLSRQEGTTLYMTLLASFQILLARYSGQDDIVLGTPTAGRGKTDLESVIGYFVNMLVLRTSLAGTPSFKALLERVRETCVEAYTHQDLPFVKLVEALQPVRDASRNPLFQVFFTFQNDALHNLCFPELTVHPLDLPRTTAKFDLNVSIGEGEHGLAGYIEYNTDIFAENTIARLVMHWETLLHGITTNPEQSVYDLPLLADTEYQHILYEHNATARSYAVERCLHTLFEAQAQQSPDAVALAYEDQQLTYSALDQRANQLAHHLAQMIQPGTPVGLCLERSPDMALTLLAILKCGGVYVPLEPMQPQKRLNFILADAQISVIVTHSDLLASFPQGTGDLQFVCLDTMYDTLLDQSTLPLAREISSDFPAYIIYTSGSTGTPKGVLNTHRALHNRLAWMLDAVAFTPDDHVAQKTPYSFDASLWEFFVPWMVGARLVMARPGGHQDSAYLCSFLQKEAITILQLVPSMLHVLLQEADFVACDSLRHVFCGGEVLPLETLRRFYSLSQAHLHNLYGPTEASIDATYWPCDPRWTDRVPIGRALTNMQVYILDRQMQPLPDGCIGELYIGGSGLALGYLHRSDLTAERFLPHPFSPEPGARLYRTGDKARYRTDGLIEYLGRTDQQTKLRGYRIEPGEIEAVLNQHEDIQRSVVVVQNDSQGEPRLIAYVVAQADTTPVLSELRRYLFEHLPFYMLPTHIIPLTALPYLNNGKLDYKALPLPQETDLLQSVEDEGVYSPTETMLCELCKEYLHVAQVSRYANFFELGGHSLLATRLINRIRDTYQIEIPLSSLFAASTLAEFAELIDMIVLTQGGSIYPEGSREEGVL